MPLPGYIETPQTTAGHLSFADGIDQLDNMSPEKSVLSPSKGTNLLSGARRGMSLATPRAGHRDVLRLLPNGSANKFEFSPMMKSGSKRNRRSSTKKGIQEPSVLHDSRLDRDSPALPQMGDLSRLHAYAETTSSSTEINESQMPQIVSSSVASTPQVALPYRDGRDGVVADGNVMSLRDQEKMIDKIEKDNFGLKMKIHFLERALSQRGDEFNKAALQENTNLKVNSVTMRRELHNFKKIVAQAEKDAEVYRLQLIEYRERLKRKQADESIRIEIDSMQAALVTKDERISVLERDLKSNHHGEREVQNLQSKIEDLVADLREKERLVDERDDQIDALKAEGKKESNMAGDLEDQLDNASHQIEELREDLDRARNDADLAKQEREDAVEDQRQAENDLEELRDEMNNKSFSTPGLNRQLEEKATKLEEQLEDLQQKNTELEHEVEEKRLNERVLQERLRSVERESTGKDKLQVELDSITEEKRNLSADLKAMAGQVQAAVKDVQEVSEEKDLLQSRHDALTQESETLQRDLSRAQKAVKDLEAGLEQEREHAAKNDHHLRSKQQNDIDLLNEQLDEKHQEINTNNNQYDMDREDWETQRRTLESEAKRAEERASGLQRTLGKLQEVEGTLSSKETKLREALESEQQRHGQEEQVLRRQIQELNDCIASKRGSSEDQRTELDNAREELRISIRDQASLKQKVEELEDEVEVMQAELDEIDDSEEKRRAEVDDAQQNQQGLRDQLATVNVQLHRSQESVKDVQSRCGELEKKLLRAEQVQDNTFNIDHEKRELRRNKQKLEKDIECLRVEYDSLRNVHEALERDFDVEANKASMEEDRLRDEIMSLKRNQTSNSSRDLSTAKSKITQLEKKLHDLQSQLDAQTIPLPGPEEDVSLLRSDLASTRHRETNLRSQTRGLKTRITTLESEIHSLQLARLTSPEAGHQPTSPLAKTLSTTRADLLNAQTQLKDLRVRNRTLEAQLASPAEQGVADVERADLHAHLKTATLEAENLAIKLSERDARIKRVKSERERAIARAEAGEKQLEVILGRYEGMLERKAASDAARPRASDAGDQMIVNDKLQRGLVKEVVWLRARCRREEGFRRDLAWSKGFMEMGETLREACNKTDLRLLEGMGVRPLKSRYENRLALRQRFRAAVYTVIAVGKMQGLERGWRDAKRLGEGIRNARGEKAV